MADWVKISAVSVTLMIFMWGCTNPMSPKIEHSSHFANGKFHNEEIAYGMRPGFFFKGLYDFLFGRPKNIAPQKALPAMMLTRQAIERMPDYSVVRLGHSMLLFRIEGELFLTDPIFSEKATPVSWLGPKRFHPNPIEPEALPPLKAVLLSHNHYDHFDTATLKLLKGKTEQFLVPLGLKSALTDLGIEAQKITEHDWHENSRIGSVDFTLTPTQHFSGRTLFDSMQTLWGAWVITAPQANLYFGSDSGYYGGFKRTGKRYGPFDMTFVEVGAYDAKWPQIHMLPRESVQAHLDLQGRVMFPIHNGTFALAFHSWFDPLERVVQAAQKRQVRVTTPMMGQIVPLKSYTPGNLWWRESMLSEIMEEKK